MTNLLRNEQNFKQMIQICIFLKKKSIGLFLLLGNCKLGLNLQPCTFLSPESEQVVYKLAHVQYVLDDTSLVADSPILHRAHLATNIMDALRLK